MFYNYDMTMAQDNRELRINITSAAIIKAAVILFLFYLIYLIGDILILFFVSLVFSSALDPWADKLKKKKIPRSASVIVLYFMLFSIFGAVLYFMTPPIIKEINGISDNFPAYVESISSKFSLLKDYSEKYGIAGHAKNYFSIAAGYLQNTASGVFFALFNIFGGIFSFVLILVLTFYMTVEESAMKKIILVFAPKKIQPRIMNLANRIQLKMGYWLSGQIIVSLSLGAMSYAGLEILGIDYALVLAVLIGFFSFIPYLGVILGAIPAILAAFAKSPLLSVFAIALFYVIHLIESNFLQPKVMQKAVGLNPIVSILAILSGFKLAGFAGAILAIPVTAAFSVIIKDVFENMEEKAPIQQDESSIT